MPIFKSFEMMRSDIYEEGDNYVVEVDIPGFQRKDIAIDYNKGNLNISAKREEDKEDKNKKYIRRERYYGEYKRSFYIGEVDESLIKAKFDNGILKISFPKKQIETANKKLIEIE